MLDNNDTSDFSNPNNLCMGCMQARSSSEKCGECGWVEGTQPNSPLYLAPRTELNNRYVIGRVLGHGGFGITYIAWDKELQIKVAIKEYLPEGLGSRAQGEKTVSVYSGQYGEDFVYGLEKFLAEARTLARFQSNVNIISILNFFKENGTAYIVMEYVEGISLKQHLQFIKDGRMPLYEALTYIMPVADALSIVHAEGILHRDISPDNIYITKDYQVKLLDFGASRKAISEVNKSLSVLLKPGYAPIEQYSSKGSQGPWTDEYALVATLYKLITGITPPESIDRMQGSELETLASLGVEVPEGVEKVIIKALSIQPQERYQSIQEFKTELNKALSLGSSESNAKEHSDKVFTTEKEQIKTSVQQTGILNEDGRPRLKPASGRIIRNKKAFIAVVVILILALPAAVYGYVNFNKSKPASTANNAITNGATPAANQTEIVKKQELQTPNVQQALVGSASTPIPIPTAAPTEKILNVGSDITYAPFEFMDEKQQVTGFDIDLINALGTDMGYTKVNIESYAFDGLIPSLQAGKFDAVISAMPMTPDRAKNVQFSDKYFKSTQYIAMKKSAPFKSLADLKGKRIGVQLNTTGQFAVEELGMPTKKYDTTPDAMNDLLNGGVDAVVADGPIVLWFQAQNPNAQMDSMMTASGQELYGIAVKLGNKELGNQINASLKNLMENGEYNEIYKKWFKRDAPKF